MATTVIKKYSEAPYYDDFDETKNFHRILFRPGYSVQARELTQMQSLLQAQIDRHGQYTFKDGSRVVNGKATLDINYDFIKVESSFTHSTQGALNTDTYLSSFVGTEITGSTSGVVARVVAAVAAENSDPNTLYIVYENAGTATTAKTFTAAEEFVNNAGTPIYGKIKPSGDTPTGKGSVVHLEEGVYFIGGNFVYVAKSDLILDKYTNTPNYIVGLKVTESIIDSSTDTSLLDNAQGVPNTAAPGATRYKIGTTLIKQAITSLDPAGLTARADATNGEPSYVTLLTIKNGAVDVDQTDKTIDTELTKRLAERTFDESGHYTVEPFTVTLKEYLNTGSNNGYRTTAEIISDGDAANTSAATTYGNDRVAVFLGPGKAYVKGHKVHLPNGAADPVVVQKPRTATETDNGAQSSLNVGNYVKVLESGMKGVPDVNTFTTLTLYNATNAGGSAIGTARARNLLNDSASGVFRLYLFDVSMTGSNTFSAVQSVKQTSAISGEVQFQANVSGTAQFFDVGNNGLVFKLPQSAIKTTRSIGNASATDIVYRVKEKFSRDGSTGTATITITDGSFVDITNSFVFINAGGTIQTKQIGANSSWYALSNNNQTLQLNVSTIAGANSTDVQFIGTIQKSGNLEKTKSRTDSATVTGALSNGSLSLGKADIIQVRSVVDANSTNITSKFTLDNGQRDNFYDVGKVILKSGETVSGNITVTFDYYSHGAGDYFTVDSYPSADYGTIQDFNSIQGKVNLRDCIDFRPRREDNATDFDGTGGSHPQPPATGQVISIDLEYYLPRIDKLVLTRKGELKVEEGVADLFPKSPKAADDAMGIYDIRLAPYGFSLDDIKPKIIDNKRYTMRDIGSLDKRLKNLEYYTSLSLLEQSAADVELFDGSGFSRLKNGFIVDGFRGHNVGDPSNPDYKASIDKKAGLLRPQFDERNVNLIRKSGDTGGAVLNGSIVTLPFTEQVWIDQPYASTFSNVNPYNVFTWEGVVKLSPETDEWKETDIRPSILIDDSASYDQFAQMAEETGILGTVWNEWETNWTGVDIDVSTNTTGNENFFNEFFFGGMGGFGFENFRGFNTGGRQSNTTTTTTTTTSNQSRTGLSTSLAFDTVTRSDGSRVVEINFIPFIRSREVYFKAELLKPNTTVYAFFDGISIANYIKEKTFAEFSGRSSVDTFEGSTSHPDTAGALVSDANGVIEGSFIIPRNDALRFATGVRKFRLSDDSTNNKNLETTYAEAQYFAQGLLESTQETVVSTKVPRLETQELNDTQTIVDTNVATTTEWIDPIAETILIKQDGGIFAKSVDIYFKSKDTSIPVRLTIRTTLNGTPTQMIVPGADKIVYPGSVNTSADASVATNFAFDYPVYLAQDVEYAIVLTSMCDKYEVYIAEMGGFDLTNTTYRIVKQPYDGVFFSSANASTWTPEQSKDLKFKLNRAKFSTSGSAGWNEITFVNDILPAKKLTTNPLSTTSSSATVKVIHKNHGMHDSQSRVTISGAVDTNGITAANLNGTYTITNITHDSYEFTAGASATATGAGGGSAVKATENRHIDVLHPYIQNITVPGTTLKTYATMRTTQSVDGNETAYQNVNEFQFLPNQNIKFAAPRMVGSAPNETQHMSGAKSFSMRCALETTSDYLSPVIDMNRLSLFTIQNIVGDGGSASTGEAVSRGGSELARYITKKVELNEEADIATVYLNVNRPGASNVLLFYRALPGGSGSSIEDVAFTLASPVDGDIPINERGFEEVRYDIDPTGSFGTIQFKIVLTSTNSSAVPKIKDLRAICAT